MLKQRFREGEANLRLEGTKNVARVTWIMVVICVLLGCGYKTRPRPATQTVPGEIGILDGRAYPDRVVLRWDMPGSNTDGSALADISGFKVYRLTQEAGEECENCEDKKVLHANVDFSKPSNAVIEKGEVVYTDDKVSPGHIYNYSVACYNLQGKEGPPSQDISVVFEEPLPPPENVRVDYDSRGVVLRWDSPTRPAGIRAYRIYRGESDRPEDLKPIGGTKWAENSFVDKTADKDKTYYYQVRSIRMSREIPIESLPSPVLSANLSAARWPPPEGVRATANPRSIGVVWEPVKLDGQETRYNVYRSESGKPFERINTEPIRDTRIRDTKVTKGRAYRYQVTAFPSTKPEEESSRSASESVTFAP
jgi:fibronectin type 3 domain-containing protein